VTICEARRMKDIPFSGIRRVFERVNAMNAEGRCVVPFHIGRPDFDTPQHIKEAAKCALDQGLTAYTSNFGLRELREAIAQVLIKERGWAVDSERQIIVTVGANEGVLLAMLAILNPGDEVLIPDPMWLHYFYCARLSGARVVSVPLRESNEYQLDPADLEERITSRTRMIVINTPHNPTGAMFTREVIEAVADIVHRHGLILVSDEIYEKMVYGDAAHVSPCGMDKIADQTIMIHGFSKTYAMTGWRLGYVVASPHLIDIMIRVHQYTTVCATSFAQAGAIAALASPQDCVREMLSEFERRRTAIIAAFADMPGTRLVPPRGAFYAFPNVSALSPNSREFSDQLLERAAVAVVPGSAFGEYGEGHVRISYACSLSDVQRGMAALREFCLSMNGAHAWRCMLI
jgi:aminotransferase